VRTRRALASWSNRLTAPVKPLTTLRANRTCAGARERPPAPWSAAVRARPGRAHSPEASTPASGTGLTACWRGGLLRSLVTFRAFRAAVAFATLVTCIAARGDNGVDLRVRRDAWSKRALVARDIAVGGLAGAVLSGGVLAYTSSVANQGSQDWKPVLATGVGVGLLVGLAVGMIEANRYGHDEPARPTSDGLSFREQHSQDRSGVFVAGLPPVRF
jgi:hypothetical protein